MYSLASFLFLILYLLRNAISEETKFWIFGTLIILVLGTLILVNLVFAISIGCIAAYTKIYWLISIRKQRLNKEDWENTLSEEKGYQGNQ